MDKPSSQLWGDGLEVAANESIKSGDEGEEEEEVGRPFEVEVDE